MTFANFFTKKNEKDILGSGGGLGECFSESFRELFSESFRELFFREGSRSFREIFSGSFFSGRFRELPIISLCPL